MYISGSIELDDSATITGLNSHRIYFESRTYNTIITNGVELPRVSFRGELGQWILEDIFICESILFSGGTLQTNGSYLETDSWSTNESSPKLLVLGSSHIKVNGTFDLSVITNINLTLDAGTSLIECNEILSRSIVLNDLQLNNSTNISFSNYPITAHKIILNGTGNVSITNDFTLDLLVFEANESKLSVNPNAIFYINEGVESNTGSGLNIGTLKSTNEGIAAEILSESHNLCAIGNIKFHDIASSIDGVFNAPNGIDDGNVSGITFDIDDGTNNLYWIKGTGDFHVKANWAKLSGGCPAGTSPESAIQLVFDNNGINSGADTVAVKFDQICNKILFTNTSVANLNL